jgi:hypothetical protein
VDKNENLKYYFKMLSLRILVTILLGTNAICDKF